MYKCKQKVAICILSYNRKEFLIKAIESVFAQTIDN